MILFNFFKSYFAQVSRNNPWSRRGEPRGELGSIRGLFYCDSLFVESENRVLGQLELGMEGGVDLRILRIGEEY